MLSLEVGLDDGSSNTLATQPVFQIWGDGKVLWTSPPIRGKGHMEKCDGLNVRSIRFLELRVNCPGDRAGTGAVWFEPALTLK